MFFLNYPSDEIPKVDIPIERVDFIEVKNDPHSKVFSVRHGYCGGNVFYIPNAVDPPMSNFVCDGEMWNSFNCPFKPNRWTEKELQGMSLNELKKLFFVRAVIDENEYRNNKPVKLVTQSNGLISYRTTRPMTNAEIVDYYKSAIASYRKTLKNR